MNFGRSPALMSSSSRCGEIVVAENLLFGAGLADALDHRIVVEGVGQDEAAGHQLGDGGDAGLVRHIARGEDQRRFLAVQVGELALELDQRMVGAGDVAGAAGAGAHARGGVHHGADDARVLRHAEIVVGAPDHDVTRPLRRMPGHGGEAAHHTLEIGKNPVAPLLMQTIKGGGKEILVIHALCAFFDCPRRSRQGPRYVFKAPSARWV